MTSGLQPHSVSRLTTIGRWLFLCGVLVMVTGDGPRSTIRLARWPTPFPWLAWEWLYLVLLGIAIACLAAGGGFRWRAAASVRFLRPAVALLLGAALLSAIFSQAHLLSAMAFTTVLGILAFGWVVAVVVDDDRLVAALWPTLAAAVLFLAFRVIVWRRDEGLDVVAFQVLNNAWVGKLQLAWVFNLFGPLMLARLLGEPRWTLAALYALTWAGAGLATTLLYSRMGSVVFAAATIGMCLLNRDYWRRWLAMMAGLLVIAAIVLGSGRFARSISMSGSVVSSIADVERNPGISQRLGVWRDALRLFRDHPVTGTGIGTFDEVAYTLDGTRADLDFRGNGWHAHNVYLHVLAEAGIPGLAAWCWFWYLVVARLARLRWHANAGGRLAAAAAICAVLAFLVLATTEVLIGARVHASLRMNLTLALVTVLGLHGAAERRNWIARGRLH
jgi:O-antigen ligase